MNDKLEHAELTFAVIGCAQGVHRALGPGFPEGVYQRALSHELLKAKVPFESEKGYQVVYDDAVCGEFRTDLVVNALLVVELKALSELNEDHLAQVLSYLKASGLHLGLLLNFGRKSLEVRRVIL